MDDNKEKVEIDKETFEKLSALPDVVNNLVEELKTERKSKQEAEARAIVAEAALNPAPVTQPVVVQPEGTPEDPVKVVERLLAERDQAGIAAARENAVTKFKSANKDFHPENDPAGLKYAAFEKELSKLNLTGAKTEADFMAFFNDALTLMNRPAPQERTLTPYADTPSEGGAPNAITPNGLTSIEKKVIAQIGWSEERYLKTKKSRPAFVEQLLANAK